MRGHGTSVPSGNILKARAVEKGAMLVAAPQGDVVVILQMPRGNLEAVYPRSLVLPAVAALVQVSISSAPLCPHCYLIVTPSTCASRHVGSTEEESE